MLRVRWPQWGWKDDNIKNHAWNGPQSSGEINLLGKPDSDVTIKEEIGVMFDQPYFQEDWTPLDIEKGIRPFYHDWNSEEYHQYLSRFELDPKKKFKDFSRGMKMKLAMAVNLSHNAKLLLLDEPTGDSILLPVMKSWISCGNTW